MVKYLIEQFNSLPTTLYYLCILLPIGNPPPSVYTRGVCLDNSKNGIIYATLRWGTYSIRYTFIFIN